jgi:hypothetical protein
MSGFLKIYPIAEKQDWQRNGYAANYCIGCPKCPTTLGLPFFFKLNTGLTVSEFKIRPVTILTESEKTNGTAISLTAGWITKVTGSFHDQFYYAANQTMSLTNGFWEYYIKMSNGAEYYSELFYVPVTGEMISATPDFNNDFNNDFKIS